MGEEEGAKRNSGVAKTREAEERSKGEDSDKGDKAVNAKGDGKGVRRRRWRW